MFRDKRYRLIVIDIPFSIFYLGGTHIDVTFGSLVVGALWWGWLFIGFSRLIAIIKKRDKVSE